MKPQYQGNDLFRESIGPLWETRNRLASLEGEDTLAAIQSFSPPQRLVFALAELDAEGGAGGWDSFIRVSGYLLPTAVEALRSIGPLPYLARAEEILALFTDDASLVSNARREDIWEPWFGQRADQVTDEFFQLYWAHSIRASAEAFIQAHMDDFFSGGV
jgi:hypothetical protein